MALEDGGYLPPIVIDILGRNQSALAAIMEVKAALADLAKPTTAPVSVDDADAMTKLAGLETALDAFAAEHPEATADVDIAPALASIAALKAALGSLGGQVVSPTVGAHPSVAAALGSDVLSGAGSGVGGGFLSGLLAGRASGGGGGNGFLSRLLWGGGSGGIFGFGAGLAGMGSLASFAGLGPEHLAMTGLGLAGSATGALAGGGLLALGGAGVMGVGMGTDMAGIGQAAGDIRQYNQLQGALASAAAVYGKSSVEYKLAAYNYQQWSQDLSKGTIQAVANANTTATAFHAMFDKVTGDAETTGANIINQLMKVGEKFLPTIGKYAAENMTTIQQGLQPLLKWLQGPGLSIFKDLEQEFSAQLPTAMKAFDNGVELFMKIVDDASHYTGGFTTKLANLLQKLNGPEWPKVQAEIGKLIGLFHTWAGFISELAKDIYQIFHADAGTGQSIVQTLTQMLTKLHTWLASTQGQSSLHNIFETHKQEIQELLKLLPPLLKMFGNLELNAGPALTKAFTDALKVIVPVLNALTKFKPTAVALGFALIATKLGLIAPAARAASAALKSLFAEEALARGGPGVKGASALGNASGPAGLTVGAGVLSYESAHYADKHKGLKSTLIGGIPNIFGAFGMGISIDTQVKDNWRKVEADTKSAWDTVKSDVSSAWGVIKSLLSSAPAAVASAMSTAWNTAKSTTETAWNAIKSFFSSVWGSITGAFNSALGAVKGAVSSAWGTTTSTTESAWNTVGGFFSTIWNTIKGTFNSALSAIENALSSAWGTIKSSMSSSWSAIQSGLGSAWNGIESAVSTAVQTVVTTVQGIKSQITGFFSDAGSWLYSVGAAIVQGLVNGITSVAGRVASAVQSIVNDVKKIPVVGGLIGSPSPYFTEVGQAMMQGLRNGLVAMQSLPLSALRGAVSNLTNVGALGGGASLSGAQMQLATAAALPSSAPGVTHNYYANSTVNAQTNADAHEIGSTVSWQNRGMLAGLVR